MSCVSRRRAASLLIALTLVIARGMPAGASSFLDPRLHFRTLSTPHFVIYFHTGEDRLAAQLASIVEEVWQTTGQALGVTAPRRTHVMLVDQSEAANGWATPLPYNTVYITAAAPAGYEYLGNYTDWLRLVFTHEFTHIVHLDYSRSWARLFRNTFGRTPIAFPNLWLPHWQIEGLAVWEESRQNHEGRQFAGDFRALETLPDRATPLDRANGGTTRWPGGLTPYAAGIGFHEFLAREGGDASLAALASDTAARLPFFGSPAFKKVYGRSLGTLWNEYSADVERRRNATRPPPTSARQVTRLGYVITSPRFSPPTCDGCAPDIVFSRRGPDQFPGLYAVPAAARDNGASDPPERLTTRYLGAAVAVDREVLVFDQQEIRRNSGTYSDLFVLHRASGRTRALTREGRFQEPDLSPDGMSIAAVRDTNGDRELVVLRLSESLRRAGGFERATVVATAVVGAGPGVAFNTPRWSPDGTRLVAARQRPGTTSELVIVHPASASVQLLAGPPRSRIVTPTWTPDGESIVAALAPESGTFDLYLFPASPGSPLPARRITVTAGGALWPDVSNDGRALTFAGQTAAGSDVFVMPFDPVRTETSPLSPPLPVADAAAPAIGASSVYRPWPTLLPTSWFPLIEVDDAQTRLGAEVSGSDVLRRHVYAASATWLVSGPDDAERPSAGTPDWDLAYAYERWRPTLFVSSSSETLFAAGPPSRAGLATNITVREREVQAGVLFAAEHFRATHRALVSALAATDRVIGPGEFVNGDRVALRVAASTITARTFNYSISQERGIAAGATLELGREALGASADATTGTVDVRAYLPLFGQHDVVAIRAGGGTTSGAPGVRRTFLLGGVDNAGDVINFSRDAIGLLRGFPSNTFAGSHVAVINADYRVPLARPERGAGTWPLFLHTVYATAFADIGHAWTGGFNTAEIKTSAGGELVFRLVAGYSLPLDLALGGAWGRDGATNHDRTQFYGRITRSF